MIQAVKTYVKKMRMGMVEEPIRETRQEDGENGDGAMADDEDEVQR